MKKTEKKNKMFNLRKRKILFFSFFIFALLVGLFIFSFNNQSLAKEKQSKIDFYFFYSKPAHIV